MKNKILSRIVAAATMLLAMLAFGHTAKAQGSICGPYTIKNNLNCPVMVTYMRTCNGNPCGVTGTQPIGPMNSIILPACPCNGVCNVKVTVNSVGSVSLIPPPSVDSTFPNDTFTTTCPGAAGTLNWGLTSTSIN